MVFSMASRWMHFLIMGVIRVAVLLALILGLVWVIKTEDASSAVMVAGRRAMNEGKRYVWNYAGEVLNG